MRGDAVAGDIRHLLWQQAALDVAGSGEIRLYPLPLQRALVEACVLYSHGGLHGETREKILLVQCKRAVRRHDDHQIGKCLAGLVAKWKCQP